MIPLRDLLPAQRKPVVTIGIIVACVTVWIVEVLQGPGLAEFVRTWGLVPAALLEGPFPRVLLTPFTSMFMHGGWMHVISNLWFLWIFGDNVEDAFGHVGFILFYIAGGLGASALQVAFSLGSPVPMVGASGAIAAVLAAYLCFYPRARVLTLVAFFIFIRIIEVPAFLFIAAWFAIQLLSGCASIGLPMGGVAWWAHVGGFVAGWVIARIWKSYMMSGGRNLPGSGPGAFTFHVHRPGRRKSQYPTPDDLMPPGDRSRWS